eukprot:15472367-Alexandrium_andersonii.AAC.1
MVGGAARHGKRSQAGPQYWESPGAALDFPPQQNPTNPKRLRGDRRTCGVGRVAGAPTARPANSACWPWNCLRHRAASCLLYTSPSPRD